MIGWIAVGVFGVLLAGLLGLWIVGERGRLLLPSTREWIRQTDRKILWSGRFFNGYVYARWSKQYFRWAFNYHFPTLDPDDGKPHWATKYHGKVVPTELAKALITVDEPICREESEQVIPFEIARTLVLDSPPDVAVYDCPCREARGPDACKPIDVCMVVGQPFVDFILEHHPDKSRQVTQEEAVAILEAEHDRGHVHAAYFKDLMLNRFYAICNCCSCCCGGIEAMRRGVPMVIPSGYVAQIDPDECFGCADCVSACPFEAIEMGREVAEVTWEKCMGCGVCVDQCENDVIELVLDERKGLPLDVRSKT